MKKKLKLFLTFFKIGAFTFGGGYAMIPIIQKEVVDKEKWLEKNDILDIVAISESTPGPIAVNMATFVGYRVSGFWGAAAATFGVVLPSFIIITVISYILGLFMEARAVQYAFWGIRGGVLALLIKALVSMYKQCPKTVIAYILAAAALLVSTFTNVNVLFIILGCAIIGLASFLLAGRKGEKQ